MQSPEPVLESSAFQLRLTTPQDIEAIESIAAQYTRRAPVGLIHSMEDPKQQLWTILSQPEAQIVGFVRFKIGTKQIQWTDLVVNPSYLDADLQKAVVALAHNLGQSLPVRLAPGLATKPWKQALEHFC